MVGAAFRSEVFLSLGDLLEGIALIGVGLSLSLIGTGLATNYWGVADGFAAWHRRWVERNPKFLRGPKKYRTVSTIRSWGAVMALVGIVWLAIPIAALAARVLAVAPAVAAPLIMG